MIPARIAAAAIALAAITSPASMAQDEQPDTATTETQERRSAATPDQPGDSSSIVGAALRQGGPRVSLRGSHRLQFDSDFDDAPGDFSVNRTVLGVNIADAINETASYSLDFQIEHSSYDFSNATALAPGSDDPLSDALALTFTPSFRFAVNETWAVLVGGTLSAAGETDADYGDAFRAGLFGGVERRFSNGLTLSAMIAVWSRLEDDPLVFPIIGVSWQVNDLTRIQTRGIGAEIISDLGNGWSLGARGAWEYREFRMSDESTAPIPEGILRDSGVVTSLELAFKPSDNIVLAIEGGGVFAQEFELTNRRGRRISETDADTALFIGFRASIAF